MEFDLADRGRSLEEAFFRKRDLELLEAMRHQEAMAERKKALAEVSGITNEAVLEELIAHGIHAEAVTALALVPMIEVVWADGEMQDREREAVLAASAKQGIGKDSPAFALIEHWLHKRPPPQLLKLWKEYVQALLPQLPPPARRQLKDSVIDHARAVAEAAGGFLGLARISAEEQALLKYLEAVFDQQS
jgi:hypothetical protein